MKFDQKNNLFLVLILALTTPFPAQASQAIQESTNNLVQHFSYIKNKTVTGLEKIKPEELENQISPVIAEVQKIPNIHEQLTDQLFEIMLEIMQQESDEAKKLKDELNSLHFTATTQEEIAALPYEFKEKTIRSLGFDAVTAIFDHIGAKIFGSKNPFKIPDDTTCVSQFDMFLLLGITLTMQEANPVKDELHRSLMSCVGLRRSVLKIERRLHKAEISDYIPNLMSKYFNPRNPLRIAAIVNHINNLTVTYHN